MQKINNNYVDENNNSWDSNIYTEKQAIKFSKTLVNCGNCINCSDCSNCNNCEFCSNCSFCSFCQDCNYCQNGLHSIKCFRCSYFNKSVKCNSCNEIANCYRARNCYNCNTCNYCIQCELCSNCTNCIQCDSCTNCSQCSYCRKLVEYKSNPNRIVKDNIGSRKDSLTVYWLGDKTTCVTGCFIGNIENFLLAVEKTHGDNEFGKEYKAFIDKVLAFMK